MKFNFSNFQKWQKVHILCTREKKPIFHPKIFLKSNIIGVKIFHKLVQKWCSFFLFRNTHFLPKMTKNDKKNHFFSKFLHFSASQAHKKIFKFLKIFNFSRNFTLLWPYDILIWPRNFTNFFFHKKLKKNHFFTISYFTTAS